MLHLISRTPTQLEFTEAQAKTTPNLSQMMKVFFYRWTFFPSKKGQVDRAHLQAFNGKLQFCEIVWPSAIKPSGRKKSTVTVDRWSVSIELHYVWTNQFIAGNDALSCQAGKNSLYQQISSRNSLFSSIVEFLSNLPYALPLPKIQAIILRVNSLPAGWQFAADCSFSIKLCKSRNKHDDLNSQDSRGSIISFNFGGDKLKVCVIESRCTPRKVSAVVGPSV